MKKKNTKWVILAVALVAAIILEVVSVRQKAQEATGGAPSDAVTAEGTAKGMDGDITVSVTATADKIYAVNIVSANETEGIGTLATDQLPGAIVEANSLDVDGVTGATISSNAVKEAVKNALTAAGLDPSAFGADTATASTEAATEAGTEGAVAEADEAAPADAVTAEGTAKGMDGDITVKVTATQDKIYSVQIVSANETEGIGTVACDKLPGEIVAANSLQVDGVTGATVSSDAIKQAIRNALQSAGIDDTAFDTAVATDTAAAEDAEYDTDVVIVGAGGAGLTAAITAADAGEDVLILESQSMAGGNSIRATGGMNAAKTVYQDENTFDEGAGVEKTLASARSDYADNETIQKLADTVEQQYKDYQANPEGYFDSVELFELDTMIGGKGINNPDLVATLAENSADSIDWLETQGVTLHSVSSFGGASVKRIHRPVDADGKTLSVGSYMIPILEQDVADRSIDILYNTTADKILTDDNGNAVGVEAKTDAGGTVTVNAKAVVLTTGGFGANAEMVEKYRPEYKGFMTTNAPGAQGQGIDMATAIGAATVDMDQIQVHPTVQVDTAALITEGLRGDGAILVNQEGDRFIDEVGTRDVVSAAEIAQTGSQSWLVIDQKMVDASNVIQGYINSGYTVTGNTPEELAEAMGIEDPSEFAKTLSNWNTYVENKNDPDFGRTSFAKPLDTAPYYAIHVTAAVHHTMGGLKIDTDTEVLKEDGSVIPGLFAAGEVTGGVHGANRLGGNAVADFVVFGRIAGQSAADYAQAQ